MVTELRSICVYCGSSDGRDPVYHNAARMVGRLLAAENVRLVYGGGSVGLMGILADAVLAAGGEAVGVIPRGLFAREIAHCGLSELHEVASMHQRKQLMFDLSDGFAALPGGLGTLEELAEITTWAQLGLHRKPIALLDVNDYWRPLLDLLDGAVHEGFMKEENRDLIMRVSRPDDLVAAMRRYRVPVTEKWISREEV